MTSEDKRTQMDQILAAENIFLQEFFKGIDGIDLDYLLSSTMSGDFPAGGFIELKTQNERGN